MSEFVAQIRGTLDLSKAKAEMSAFLNQEHNLKFNVSGIDNAKKQLESITSQKYKANIDVNMKKNFTSSDFTPNVKEFANARVKIQKEINGISKDMQKVVPSGYNKSTDKWAGEYVRKREQAYKADVAAYQKEQANLQKIKQKELSSGNYANTYQDAYKAKYSRSKELTDMKNYYAEEEKLYNQIEKIKQRATSGEFEYNTAKNSSFLSNYRNQDSNTLSRAKEQIQTISNLQRELQSGKNLNTDGSFGSNLIPEETISKAQKLDNELKNLSVTMKTVSVESSKTVSGLKASAASNSTLTWLKNNSKAAKEYGTDLKKLAELQRKAKTEGELREYNEQVRDIKTTAAMAGKTGRSFSAEVGNAFSRIGQFVGIYGVLQRGVSALGNMAHAVLDVDSAFVELHKVSTATPTEITDYFDRAATSAKKYGATISDVVNSTADWSRLGYNLEDASVLSDATTLLQKVGDNMTQESSSEGLISILKGFGKEATDANSIIDSINEVDMLAS